MQTSIIADAPAGAAPNGKGDPRAIAAAELDAMRKAEPIAAAVPPKETTPVVEPVETPEVETDGAGVDPASEPVVEPDPAPDPLAAKGLAAVQKAERRHKEQVAAWKAEQKAATDAARAEIEEQRGAFAAQAAKIKEYEALRAKASSDPLAAVELLRSLGYKDDAFAPIAYAAWAETPKGKENPANRAQAERLARDRSGDDRVAALEKKLAERDERDAKREQEAATERAVGGFLDAAAALAETGKVTEDDGEGNEVVTATVEAPIFKRWLKSDRAAARHQILVVGNELAEKAQRERDPMPTPAEVLAEVEKRERIALRKRGIDPATLAAAVVAPPKKPGDPPSKTLSRTGAGPAVVKPKLTPEEERADFIRRRDAGKLEDD